MRLFGNNNNREPRPRLTDPAYHCTLTLEVLPVDAKPYPIKVQQRMARSTLARLTGDDVIAPAWIDPVNPAKVAIDIGAGPVESATGAADVRP